MSGGACTPEQRAACPLLQHYTDTHHMAYPRSRYHTGVEKRWRDLSFNKVHICRAIHEGIHASGYIPAKISREQMSQEVWDNAVTERSIAELDKQLALGQSCIRNTPEEAA